MPSKSRVRNVCFTLNNPTDSELENLGKLGDKMTYLVWGHEVGKEGTPHVQGYCEFESQVAFSTARTAISTRAHLEPRKGKSKEAAGYCKKGSCPHNANCVYCKDFDGKFDFFFPRTVDDPQTWVDAHEFGEISVSGSRSDLSAPVAAIVEDNASIRDVAMEFPEQFVKFNKGLRDLRCLTLRPRKLAEMPTVIWLWGPTGTGKTRDAYEWYWPDEPHYVWQPSNGMWWDGYDGEKKVIIDEFRAQMTWSDILGLLGQNEFRAPYKGGFVNIQADKFVITSPFPPERTYKEDDRYDRMSQLLRRVTEVHEYTHLVPMSEYSSSCYRPLQEFLVAA